jgi:nicotinamide-nucleotide amidase
MSVDVTALVHLLIRRRLTIATAESLTGGALCARMVDVPGASETVRGGVCVYATELKAQVLGVDPRQLARTGPVDREVALQMARGARRLMGADVALSTTGVAGPGPSDGRPAGTVHVACVTPEREVHRELCLPGDRSSVRSGSVEAALRLLADALGVEGRA